MRATLTILITLLLHTTFGQVKYGTYKITGETSDILGGKLFSELIIKKDKTFTYKYLTTLSCHLWYDLEGKWEINKDTLVLSDTVISHHPVVNFTKYQETCDNNITISVKTKWDKPIQGIKILYIFKNSKDTLSGLTNSEGRFIIETNNKIATKKEEKYRSIDDVEIWVVYYSKNRQDQTTNNFSDLSAEIECVIDDNAKNENVLRTTTYRIVKTNLFYLSQQYGKEDARPMRYLYGNFKFDKE